MIELQAGEIMTGCDKCDNILLHQPNKAITCPGCKNIARGESGLLRHDLLDLILEVFGRRTALHKAFAILEVTTGLSPIAVRRDLERFGVQQCLSCDLWFKETGTWSLCNACRRGP